MSSPGLPPFHGPAARSLRNKLPACSHPGLTETSPQNPGSRRGGLSTPKQNLAFSASSELRDRVWKPCVGVLPVRCKLKFLSGYTTDRLEIRNQLVH